jgi:acid phosphatase class B
MLQQKYNVGFDFDGVIHSDVTPADIYGQRHPNIPFNTIPSTPFYKIINLIKMYNEHNYNIYIITARSSKSKEIIKKTLDNFGVSRYIPEQNIITTADYYNGDKTYVLDRLNIVDFYDDSIKIFKSIQQAKKNNMLRNLHNCYMTIPEKNKIIKINL